MEEEKKLQSQLEETEKRIERYQQMEKASKEKEAMDVDDLDDFMSGLSSEKQMDKADVRKCRVSLLKYTPVHIIFSKQCPNLFLFQFELLRIKGDIQKVKKLINIARPIELPPLKSDGKKSNESQTKKSFELPLFGKKKTFGFDKLKQHTVNAKQIKSIENKVEDDESIEEFDEDENDMKSTRQINTESVSETKTKENSIVEASKIATNCDEEIKESTSATEKEKPEIKERQKIDQKKLTTSKINDTDHHKPIPSQPSSDKTTIEKNNPEPPKTVASTKNRRKIRNRYKARQQIDIDDTEEDTSPQKYSKWVPPSNQSGDGITDLNSKYGY